MVKLGKMVNIHEWVQLVSDKDLRVDKLKVKKGSRAERVNLYFIQEGLTVPFTLETPEERQELGSELLQCANELLRKRKK